MTLLHTNDMHNRRGVFPFLESYPRDRSTLLVDGGDAIGGSNTVFHFHEPILDMMNRVGYDAMTLGNREFHYLRSVLSRRFKQVRFPFVCANVRDLRGKANDFWQPTLVKQVGDVRVGLVGLTPVQYLDQSLWQPIMGFAFQPPMEALPVRVAELRAQVDVLILLSHSGFDVDCQIARAIEGIDVIVGGHSHTVLETPRMIGGAAIVQTGSYGRAVGKMTMRIKQGGGVEIVDYRLLPMAGASSEEDLAERGGAA